MIVGYVCQSLERGPFWPLHPWAAQKMPIMNRVKETLTVRMIDSSFIAHSIVFEITFQNQKGCFVVTYWSQSQSSKSLKNSYLILINIWITSHKHMNHIIIRPFTIMLCNLHGISKSWSPENITFHEDTHIQSLTAIHGLQQLLSDSTYLLSNSSCSDLTFTDQTNFPIHHYVLTLLLMTKLSCQLWRSSLSSCKVSSPNYTLQI